MQHFTRTHLYLPMTCEKMCKTFLKGTFMCVPSFLVCANLTACVRAHTRTA